MNPKLMLLLLQVVLADGNNSNEMKLPLVTLNSIRSRKTRTYLIKIDEDDALLKSQPFVQVSSGEWFPVYQNLPIHVESSGQHHEDHQDAPDEEQEHDDHHDKHTTDREAYNIWWWTLVLNGSLFIITLVAWIMKRLNCCCHYFYVVRNYEKMKLAEKDEMIREHVKRRKQYEADGELRHTMITHSVVENDLELSGSEISRV